MSSGVSHATRMSRPSGGAIAIVASGPTCEEQIAQLNRQLLGTAPPADPEALRERDAAYEKAFATICGPPASPSPVQLTPGDYAPPYVQQAVTLVRLADVEGNGKKPFPACPSTRR